MAMAYLAALTTWRGHARHSFHAATLTIAAITVGSIAFLALGAWGFRVGMQ